MSISGKRWRMPWLVRITIAVHTAALITWLWQPEYWREALAVIIFSQAVLIATGLWPRSTWLGSNWNRLPDAAANNRQIALTIDDGPDPEVTPQVLDILDSYGVKATFFCIGETAQRHPALCRQMVARGHAVENHSQRHRHNFSLLGPCALRREIEAAQQTITGITGQTPQFFRAPAGLRNAFLDYVLHKLGLQLASWSVRGFDTRVADADRVKRALTSRMQPGAILLMHDGHAARTSQGIPVIIAVLPSILESAKESGLRFVTLRQAGQS
jgi:peptidoglycan/xylan/chitin deacetylase (PgdA/CDA1 family)